MSVHVPSPRGAGRGPGPLLPACGEKGRQRRRSPARRRPIGLLHAALRRGVSPRPGRGSACDRSGADSQPHRTLPRRGPDRRPQRNRPDGFAAEISSRRHGRARDPDADDQFRDQCRFLGDADRRRHILADQGRWGQGGLEGNRERGGGLRPHELSATPICERPGTPRSGSPAPFRRRSRFASPPRSPRRPPERLSRHRWKP